jgi:hypothetical protein
MFLKMAVSWDAVLHSLVDTVLFQICLLSAINGGGSTLL